MLYIPNNAGQNHLNQHNYKALVVQSVAKVAPLNPVVPIDDLNAHSSYSGTPKSTTLHAGQTYDAKVLTRLSARQYDVLIDGQIYRIKLDKSLQVGEAFTLKLIGNSDLSAPSNSASVAQTSSKPITSQLLQTEDALIKLPSAPPPNISSTGLLIQSLLANQQQLAPLVKAGDFGANGQAAQALTQIKLPFDAVVTAANIAPYLKQQLRMSGLFYEAHLLQFAAGIVPEKNLREEPQNHPKADIPALVTKQLEVLETKQLNWHGLAWPGQAMDWLIEVKPHQNSTKDESQNTDLVAEPATIKSKLKLTLPKLGTIEVDITYENTKLNLLIKADRNEAKTQLLKAQHQLIDAFNLQDCPIFSFEITQNDT